MKPYTHLTQEERYYIFRSLQSRKSLREIAKELGRSPSSLSRELKRNKGLSGAYCSSIASAQAIKRQASKGKKRITPEAWAWIERYIRLDWSPEQICHYRKLLGKTGISIEWIYQYILWDKEAGGTLFKHLRHRKKRRKRYGSVEKRGQLINRKSIDERPDIVDKRARLGDWEADVVEGSKGGAVLVTLLERKSRLFLVGKSPNKSAKEVSSTILRLLLPIKEYVKTITYDNGREFAYHEMISKALDSDAFFAHAYHSWERGSNENSNGLLRQYFPKGESLANVSPQMLQRVMIKLNRRPRKCLGFKAPYQTFLDNTTGVAL